MGAWLRSEDPTAIAAQVAIIGLVGWLAVRTLGNAVRRVLKGHLNPQQWMLIHRVIIYGGYGLVIGIGLHRLGVSFGLLLGTAGILTVALGFASQTVASNFISGLFLIGERPFQIGDVITVGTDTGEVISIGTLSVHIRTFDNRLVRVPNESLIKTQFSNVTAYPIRRHDIALTLAFDEDIDRVRELLLALAYRNPLVLDEPGPLFLVQGFGPSAISVQFSVWAAKEAFLQMRNSIQVDLKREFDRAGIVFPLPRQVVEIAPPRPEQPPSAPRPQSESEADPGVK